MKSSEILHRLAIIVITVWCTLAATGCVGEPREILQLHDRWEYAVGSMEDSVGEAAGYRYRPLEGLRDLHLLLPGHRGILWLRNRFRLPEEYRMRHWSLLMGNVVNTDETYVNGQFVGGYGRIPLRGKSYVNEWNRFRKYDMPGSLFTGGVNTLQVRIYAHYEGAVQGTPAIAPYDDAVRIAARHDFSQQYLHLVLFFLMLFGALYSFSIVTRRRDAEEHLYYGAACFFFALFESSFFITLVPGFYDLNIPFIMYRKIAFVPVPLVILCLIMMVNRFLRVRLPRGVMIAVAAVCAAASLAVLLLPDIECAVSLEKTLISLPALCLVAYLLLVIVPGALRRSVNALALGAGFLPFVLCVCYDVVYHVLLGNQEGLYTSGIGFAIFVLSITFVLSTDIVRYQRTVESLNRDLLSEKERLQVTLASIGDGVVATDPAGTVLLANRQAVDLLGAFGPLEPGVSFFGLMDRVDPHHDFRVLFDEISTAPKRMDFMCQSDAGGEERLTLAGSIAPLMLRKGSGGAVIVIRDISQDMKLQKEIMKMKNLESLGVLAGGIAHDFNNILMAIVGNINLAKFIVPQGSEAKEMLQE
ncbi:MAG: hypothetical protein JXA20_02285, partial [Spirochaetes bacterium]|nr:hypothetical protein [Spirochaetota bacterium]